MATVTLTLTDDQVNDVLSQEGSVATLRQQLTDKQAELDKLKADVNAKLDALRSDDALEDQHEADLRSLVS